MILEPDKGEAFKASCVPKLLDLVDGFASDLEIKILKNDKVSVMHALELATESLDDDNKTILHFAVLAGDIDFVSALLELGCAVHRGDYVTGFTPLHFALFTHNKRAIRMLLEVDCQLLYVRDCYGASVLDYALLLGILPSTWQRQRNMATIDVYDFATKRFDQWTAAEFEEKIGAKYILYNEADLAYIEQLWFSGLELGEADIEFRQKYSSAMEMTSGDENVFIAWIDDKVGYGLFAKRDFLKGDYIVRICGRFVKVDDEEERNCDYAIFTKIPSVMLDGYPARNLGQMANHSAMPNAEAFADFIKGIQDLILVAKEDIPFGYQILWDYSESYFLDGNDATDATFIDMGRSDGFPKFISEINS